MPGDMERDLQAFVLMPFNQELDALFTDVIKPTLEAEGYEVRRGDSVLDQQNVLKDIVQGIAVADLVVADLTDLNPNVFYELGLAHGLGVATILITQSLDTLPFDLRPYRANQYSMRFDRVDALRQKLRGLARARREGAVEFGSPTSDFLRHGPPQKVIEPNERGAAQPVSTVRSESPGEVAGDLRRLGDELQLFQRIDKGYHGQLIRLTKQLDDLRADEGSAATALREQAATELSDVLYKLGSERAESIDSLRSAVDTATAGALALAQRLETETQAGIVRGIAESANRLARTTSSLMSALLQLATVLGTLQGITPTLDRALAKFRTINDDQVNIIEDLHAGMLRVAAVAEARSQG